MAEKSIIIIGAGIAGLSAGCFAALNGFQTTVFEKHSIPGGLCTGWRRKGYVIDGCMHHVAGTASPSPLYKLWQELGAFDPGDVIYRDILVQVEDQQNNRLTVYTNIDRYEKHLKEIAPEDSAVIEQYCNAARSFLNIDMLAFPLFGPIDMMRAATKMPGMMRWFRMTLEQLAERFTNPFLRQAIPVVQYGFADIPAAIHLNFLAACHRKTMGWVRGGSLAFTAGMRARLRELGGRLSCNSEVERIIVEHGTAVGVQLKDGSEHRADVIVSAADGHRTIYQLLEGKYLDDSLRHYYGELPKSQQMNLHLSFGVKMDMGDQPCALSLLLNEPVWIAGKERDRLEVEVYNFDQSMSPDGKTVVKVMMDTEYERWETLHRDKKSYEEEKERTARAVLEALDTRFAGIRKKSEVIDVATPVTIARYTGNWHGLQAWMPSKKPIRSMRKGICKTLPGLDKFYMAGQWSEGMPGLSTAAVSGRSTIKRICRHEKVKFRTRLK
ncbi:MAG: phytoene desaturase family protein [Chitinivibrionales bacterium]